MVTAPAASDATGTAEEEEEEAGVAAGVGAAGALRAQLNHPRPAGVEAAVAVESAAFALAKASAGAVTIAVPLLAYSPILSKVLSASTSAFRVISCRLAWIDASSTLCFARSTPWKWEDFQRAYAAVIDARVQTSAEIMGPCFDQCSRSSHPSEADSDWRCA